MISEEYELTGKKNNPIELTGSIKQVEQLKANINIPIIHVPPVTTELEITPSDQIQIFTPPDDTFYNKVTCKAISITTNSLTITPTRQEQIFTPPISEYYNNVTCEAIPNEYIIPTGELNVTSNGVYDVTNYASANINVEGSIDLDWTELGYDGTPTSINESIQDGFDYAKQIKQNWTNIVTDGYQLFFNDHKLMFFPSVDNSNMLRMACMFQNCYSLQKVGYLNTQQMDSIGTAFRDCYSLREVFDINSEISSGNFSADNVFYNCISLENAPNISATRRTNLTGIFYNCVSLKNVPVFNIRLGITGMNNAFGNCINLTNESLNNIMGTIKNAAYFAGTKTLKDIGFSSEQATTCTTLPNWTALQNNGWTTGY